MAPVQAAPEWAPAGTDECPPLASPIAYAIHTTWLNTFLFVLNHTFYYTAENIGVTFWSDMLLLGWTHIFICKLLTDSAGAAAEASLWHSCYFATRLPSDHSACFAHGSWVVPLLQRWKISIRESNAGRQKYYFKPNFIKKCINKKGCDIAKVCDE